MNPNPIHSSDRTSTAGSDLRQRVEKLGSRLASTLGVVISQLPRRAVGPQVLANTVGTTIVTASRLLKALGQSDTVAVLQLLPGPNPLRQVMKGAMDAGVPAAACAPALAAIDDFEQLIRLEAGDRSALKAMLSAWLPEERREFEAQRRQSIFKAMTELEGVSCEFSLTSMILSPSADETHLDVINIEALLGIDRIRPDAVVQLGTSRLPADPNTKSARKAGADHRASRRPLNLDGDPATDGFHTVRLDGFCDARPAPLIADACDDYIQYSLGPTGFGSNSTVDLVVAEVNRSELPHADPKAGEPAPYFFTIPDMPTRKKVLDLVVHEDAYPGCFPEFVVYDTSNRGPARADDPHRLLDQRNMVEDVENLGTGIDRMRLAEFPRYCELQETVFKKLSMDSTRFRTYRIRVNYPLVGRQLMLVIRPPKG